MTPLPESAPPPCSTEQTRRFPAMFWGGLAILIPLVTWAVYSWIPATDDPLPVWRGGSTFPAPPLPFEKSAIGPEADGPPWITNIQLVDMSGDGRLDVIACDARWNCVWLYQQTPEGGWSERQLAGDIIAPAHASPADLDGDGRLDLLVAELGSIWPDDGVIGRVLLLRNTGEAFEKIVLLDDVRRVADVQPGDLNGDGRLDLAVAVFGYDRGQVLWLENLGELAFREHELMAAAGSIHVPIADFNGDGRPDIATVISQDQEEVWCFENQGGGRFEPRLIWQTPNFDIGSAGLVASDLDQDGRPDLILPVGDNLEDLYSYPQPYHGCLWFRNQGDWKFEAERIANFGGTYAAAVGDLDGDGHRDVVLVSTLNDWDVEQHASAVWLQNDGRQNFRAWQIDSRPTHLITVACGDLDGSGRDSIVAGGLHLTGPYNRLGRITRWSLSEPRAKP